MAEVVESKEGRSGITMMDLFLIMTLISITIAFVISVSRPFYERDRVIAFFERASALAASSATDCTYLQDGLRYEGKCFSPGPYNVFKADDTMLFSKEKFDGKPALISPMDAQIIAYVDAVVNP